MNTYVFRMISGVGFHQDKGGNLLIRYHGNDVEKIREAFLKAADELEAMPTLPPGPIIQNPLLAIGSTPTFRDNRVELNPILASQPVQGIAPQPGFKVIEGYESE